MKVYLVGMMPIKLGERPLNNADNPSVCNICLHGNNSMVIKKINTIMNTSTLVTLDVKSDNG